MIICKYCHAKIEGSSKNWNDAYELHLKIVHNRIKVYTCKICQTKLLGSDKFDRHLQFVHDTKHWDVTLAFRKAKEIGKDF